MTKTTPKLTIENEPCGSPFYRRNGQFWACAPGMDLYWHDLDGCPIWFEFSTVYEHPSEQVQLYFECPPGDHCAYCGESRKDIDTLLCYRASSWLRANFPQLKNGKPLRLYVRVLYEEKVS